MRPWRLAALLAASAILVLLAGCSADNGKDEVAADASGTSETPGPHSASTQWGVAGIIPEHYPNSSDADYTKLFDSFAETGQLIGVYTNWADNPENEGPVPRGISSLQGVAVSKKRSLVVALGTTRQGRAGIESSVDFADARQKARFLTAVTNVAREVKPAYLAIGVEVNRLWESDPAAFEAFVGGYREAYAAAKAASPSTKVFTVFQLEMLNGDAYLMGGSEQRQPEWDLVAKFDGALDLVGLTSYPFLDFETPEAVPADYYAQAAAKAGHDIIITELGWPSRPLSSAPASGYGGTLEEQAAFVRRLPELFGGSPVRAVLWSFPYDLGSASPVATFESVALRENSGSAKPALAAWRDVIAR